MSKWRFTVHPGAIITLPLLLVGLVIVVHEAGWLTATGVFLIVVSMTLEISYK